MIDAIRAAMLEISKDDAIAPALQAIFGGTKFVPGAPASYSALCELLAPTSADAFASTSPPEAGEG